MQHDDMIWSVISQGFCSFKAKLRDDVGHAGAKPEAFCRNPHNLTGICSRVNCPLANSQYATVIEKDNEIYLFIKTVERAHTPKRLWEKILLPKNFKKALEVINDNLQWWDRKVVMKCKHRLLRLKQILIRKRRLALRGMPKLVPIKKKEEKQLKKREAKAEKAARIVPNIQKELLARMHKMSVDIPDEEIEKLADELSDVEDEAEHEIEHELEDDDFEPYEMDDTDDEESDEYEESDEMSDEGETTGKRKSAQPAHKAKRRYVEIEEEREMENRLSKSVMDW